MFSGKRESMQSLELSFPVTASHFHNNKVRLKCLATIAGHTHKYIILVLVFETFIYRCYKYLLLDESNATIVMWEWCVLDRAGKRTFAKFEVEQPRAFAWLKVPTNY